MHHEGKPVIEVWGFGIVNEVTADDGVAIVTALKNAGWYVILGVQQAWHAELVENEPGRFGPVYRLADMIQPWTVGAYDINNVSDSLIHFFCSGTFRREFSFLGQESVQMLPKRLQTTLLMAITDSECRSTRAS